MDLAIQTKGLTKFYGKHLGVKDINLDVNSGEILGFIGPNGAGKTTTIRLLLDALRPTSGTASVLGLNPWLQRVELHRRIGFLPSEMPALKRLTAGEYLKWVARVRAVNATDRINQLAERLKLDLSRPTQDLSLGNRRKVGVIQAMMHQPDLIILDEPTSGLDPLMQLEFRHLLLEEKANGKTIFLSSHALDEVEHLADRVAVVRSGELIAVESVDAIRAKASVRIDVKFSTPQNESTLGKIENVKSISADGASVQFQVEGSVDALIKKLANYEVISVRTLGDDLENAFLSYYKEGKE